MKRPVCLVTGATGAIGPRVVEAMAATHDVRTLSRRPPDSGVFPTPVTAFVGDVADAQAVRRAAEGADVIVHLAALLHIVDPPAAMRSEYERINVGGTSAVMAAAVAENVSRVVFMSTIAVYGSRAVVGLVNEESPTTPDTFYGETKLSAEKVALAAHRADGVPLATVLRSAAVYGPRVKGNYERLVHALAKGRFMPIGPGDNRRTVIFEADLAAATALAATHHQAAGRIYNVSDGAPHLMRDIIAAICTALGRKPPRWHAPVAPVRTALSLAAVIDQRLPRMLDKYLEDAAVDATRIRDELGFRAAATLEEGWAATIGEMRRTARL